MLMPHDDLRDLVRRFVASVATSGAPSSIVRARAATLVAAELGAAGPGASTGPVAPLAPADPSRRLGRYVLIEELGRGGMGVVWRARDPALGRDVAIKMLAEIGPADDARRERFGREARAAAQLRHPGIASVHEVGEHAGQPFIVMDIVEGGSLEDALADETLSPRRLAELVSEVARALDHAHHHGVVHRDVKPENILLDRSDPERARPVLTDFGLAAEVEGAGSLTATGVIVGTPAYMAPEQAGSKAAIGPGTDVYGLGAVLYRALVGRPPFDDPRLLVLVRQVVVEEPRSPRSLGVQVHPDLETITLECLEKDPARRYPSAAALADDLDRFRRGEPIEARPVAGLERVRRFARRHPARAFAVAILGLAVCVAAGIGGWAFLELRRRVTADREAFVGAARLRASTARAAFDVARDEIPEDATSDEARSRRDDRLLGLGLDALAASMTLRALALEDEAARGGAFEVAMAVGEVALDAEQWSVATGAFDKAIDLGVDPSRARSARENVGAVRDRVGRAHRAEVERIIEDARSGRLSKRPGGREEAVFALVRYPEAQTVRLLGDALDGVSRRLREVTIRRLRDASSGGASPVPGFDDAAASFLALDGADLVTQAEGWEPLAVAVERLAILDGPAQAPRRIGAVSDALADAQREELGHELLLLARLCCDALGRLGIREGAVGPLGRHLYSELDPLRAVQAGVALARLGGDEAERIIVDVVRTRVRMTAVFSRRVSRYLGGGALSGGPGEPTERDADGWLQHAVNRDAIGDHDGASAAIERAIELDPERAAAWATRASIRMQRGDFAGALTDADRAIELEPRSSIGWDLRGVARGALGQVDAAIADFARAIELDPGYAEPWCHRGMLRLHTGGDAGRALADLTRAIELDPRNVEARVGRARLHHASGAVPAAIADYGVALELDPENAFAWRARGLAHASRGDVPRALSDLGRAIELDPGDAVALAFRAEVRKSTSDLDGAIADYERVTRLRPESGKAWSDYGRTLQWRGDHAEAMPALARSLELFDPRTSRDFLDRALTRWAHHGVRQDAVDDLTRALELDPRNVGALECRGRANFEMGRHADAVADLTQTLRLLPRDVQAFLLRGRARFALGELDAALADLDRAVALSPGDGRAWIWRAAVLIAKGDLDRALAVASRAVELLPKEADAWAQRAEARRRSGDAAGAIADASRSIELDPRRGRYWATRGRAHADAGQPAKAIADLERALKVKHYLDDPAGVRALLERLRTEGGQ